MKIVDINDDRHTTDHNEIKYKYTLEQFIALIY